jgi:hypothetical protein
MQENVYLFEFMVKRQREVLERRARSEFSAANANGFQAASQAEADLGVASSQRPVQTQSSPSSNGYHPSPYKSYW